MGNTENTARQNLILISATEDGQPRIDVMNGVKSKSFAGCLRARFGNLNGISDTWFPADKQPQGDGIYCDNAFLRGTFLLETGEDVKTKFEITEGKIQAAVTGIRQDFLGENGYLNNAAFADGMDKWTTDNETVFFLVGNKWVWANNNVLSKKGNSASVTTDNGRVVVRIRNKYILQKYSNLRVIPEMGATSSGLKTPLPVYLSFFYRCADPGTLKVTFEGVDKTGFVEFDSLNIEEQLESTGDNYKQYTCSGLWNGTGDFKLSFTGDIYLYMLVLSTDKVEAFTYQYKTLLEQSERLVKISAAVYDKDEALLQETGLLIKPRGAGLYAQNADGNVALIGVSVDETDEEGNKIGSSIKLTADNIQLEGLVTANGNFKILEDGSIEANAGTFKGYIKSEMLWIYESDAIPSVDPIWGNDNAYLLKNTLNLRIDRYDEYGLDGAVVILPKDKKYIGSRVMLWNGCVGPYTRTVGSIRFCSVCCESGNPIYGFSGSIPDSDLTKWRDPDWISWLNGMMELVGVPQDVYNQETGEFDLECYWCIVSFNSTSMEYGNYN